MGWHKQSLGGGGGTASAGTRSDGIGKKGSVW